VELYVSVLPDWLMATPEYFFEQVRTPSGATIVKVPAADVLALAFE
jgi:hypothetical protein